jgi:DNA replication protein DnaD
MLKVPWTHKITNENILKQVNEKRQTIKQLIKKQSRFIAHILRKGKLENIVSTGKINSRKDRKTTEENAGQSDKVTRQKVNNRTDSIYHRP